MGGVGGGGATVRQLVETLDDALVVAAEFAPERMRALPDTDNPGSLLDRCLALCRSDASPVEPVRTVHQMACTGGTLFAKCIAAMPNVQLLSEVDPLSRIQMDSPSPRFCPTDIVLLLRQGSRGASDELVVRVFQDALATVHAETTRIGLRLVLRDHAHSQYCAAPDESARPTVREIVAGRLPTVSLVFVRHPLDSYLSVEANGWFKGGVDEYCRRYLRFLDDHADVPRLRYEDFVADPDATMRKACEHLDLPYADHFRYTFDASRMSGDSGRRGGDIAPRPRRDLPGPGFAATLARSNHYAALLQRLGYEQ
jgi:hypothetical protein